MKKYFLEEKIEKILWWTRFIVLIPVIVSLLIFLLLIVGIIIKFFKLNALFFTKGFDEHILAGIVSIIDISLLSVIILIFAWWIYELFVDEIDVNDQQKTKAKTLIIKDIDELKEKLGKVIIILLIVSLFKQMILNEPQSQYDLLINAWVILIMAISLIVISSKKK